MTALATPPAPAEIAGQSRIAPLTLIGAILLVGGAGLLGYSYFGHHGTPVALALMLAGIGTCMLFQRTAESVLVPVLAVLAAFVPFSAFLMVSGTNPLPVILYMYDGAFSNTFSFQNTLTRAAPLMLTGLCTALPMRLGMVIIGGEGALIVGALASAAAAHLLQGHGPLMIISSMLVAGFLMGGIWITISGALRHYRGVNETISSLLMIYIAQAIMDQLVEGPWRDPESLNKPSSWPIGDENMLGTIHFGSFAMDVHWGLLFGIVACLVAFVLMHYTVFGFSARVIGGNIRAAKVAGISVGKSVLIACMLAGGAAGLAGAIEIAAVQGAVNDSLTQSRYGYTGILVAFLARQNPVAIIPVAILIGGIGASADLLQTRLHLPDATSMVLQGMIFLMILASESYYGRFKFLQPKEAVHG